MNRIMLAAIPAGAAVAVAVLAITFMSAPPTPSSPQPAPGLTYEAIDAIRPDLGAYGISVSSPLLMSGDSAAEYCSFFAGSPPPSHCISTELKGPTGEFLGNIHMVGTASEPDLVLGAFQSNQMASQQPQIAEVADAMIQRLVCDCWEEISPGGFGSVNEWVGEVIQRHLAAGDATTTSRIEGLPQPVLMEATRSEEGHVWKILVGAPP